MLHIHTVIDKNIDVNNYGQPSTIQGIASPIYGKKDSVMKEDFVEKQSGKQISSDILEAQLDIVYLTPQFKELLHIVDPTLRKEFKFYSSHTRMASIMDNDGINASKGEDPLKIQSKGTAESNLHPVELVQPPIMNKEAETIVSIL